MRDKIKIFNSILSLDSTILLTKGFLYLFGYFLTSFENLQLQLAIAFEGLEFICQLLKVIICM